MQMVLELPCRAIDAANFDLLDADRNLDDDIERSFMNLAHTDVLPIKTLADGFIFIFCRRDDLDALSFFINEKSHDMYVYVQEREYGGSSYGKHRFNCNQGMKEIYETIAECVRGPGDGGKVIDPAYIQVYRYDNQGNPIKVTVEDRDLGLKDLLIDENILNFDILPFPLAEVTGKNVVKILHFRRDGVRNQVYTELVEYERNVWVLLREQLVPKYLKQVDGEDLMTKNYLIVLLDKLERSIVRIVSFKELVRDVVSEAKFKS